MAHKDVLDLFCLRHVAEGFKNIDKFLENRPDVVEKEKLLVKVLAAEQSVENQRIALEHLIRENEELKNKKLENSARLENIQKMRQELQDLNSHTGNDTPVNELYFNMVSELKMENDKVNSNNE